MTRQSSKQRGISLVEVVLTLGISSLLLATVLSGRNSIRSQAQFSDGMERIKEQILAVKSDANTGKNTDGDGTSEISGATNTYLLLGASLRFNTATKTSMQTANIMCYAISSTNLVCGSRLTTQIPIKRDMVTPWKIEYLGYTTSTTSSAPVTGDLTLAFSRDDNSGSFVGAWYPGVIAQNSLRSEVFLRQTEVTLHFKSSDGRFADLIVNPATGSVTRKML